MLNTGDVGLLRSLDALTAADASQSANGGATIAAHAQHVRYGLSLMNRSEAGNPFADANGTRRGSWPQATSAAGKRFAADSTMKRNRWLDILNRPRDVNPIELTGLISIIARLAYHLGAIRQIAKTARGPREGTFV